MKKIISRLIAFVVVIILGMLVNYLALPAWTFKSAGFCLYLFAMAVIALICFGPLEMHLSETEDSFPILSTISGTIAALILLTTFIGALTGAQLFNAKRYQNLIEIEEGDFATDITEVTDADIPTVDVATALQLGDRAIGTIKNSSWYEVDDEYNLIIYQGKLYRISVLNYGGFLKYNKAKSFGIPGYVLVDAITQETKFVECDPIIYSPSAYFSKNLKRHLRNMYPSYLFGSTFFEIDENGNPYYIVSVESPKIGAFGGKVVTSFILVNTSTGETTEYQPEDLPDWVDHAYSMNYLADMAYYNFEYLNGFLNHLGSQTGILKTTYHYQSSDFEGYNSMISKDGIVFYTVNQIKFMNTG